MQKHFNQMLTKVKQIQGELSDQNKPTRMLQFFDNNAPYPNRNVDLNNDR